MLYKSRKWPLFPWNFAFLPYVSEIVLLDRKCYFLIVDVVQV